MKYSSKILTTALFSLAAFFTQAQDPGDIDTSFGVGGYVLSDEIGVATEVYIDMITLDDDRVVMVGYTDEDEQNLLISRYNADGTPDATFGEFGGIIINSADGFDEQAWAVEVLSDGKMLISGVIFYEEAWNGFVMRVEENGAVDTSFGETEPGRTEFNTGDNTIALGNAIIVDGDNTIFVGGTAMVDGQSDMCLWKFTQGGGLNTSFASNGVAVVDVEGANDGLNAMARTANGQFILAGTADINDDQHGAIVMLSAFGTPTTFGGGDGYYTFDMGAGWNELTSVYVDDNGKIVAAGNEGEYPDVDGLILRLNDDGTLDDSFSGDGFQQSDPGMTTAMYLMNVFPTSDGGMVATGWTQSNVANELYALMLTASGSPNTDFGGNGDVNHPFTINVNSLNGRCSAMQSDGGILIGGDLTSEDFIGHTLFMVRLLPNSDPSGMQDFISEPSINVFPNPSADYFSVSSSELVSRVDLISMQGALVASWSSQTQYTIPNDLANGQYLVRVQGTNGQWVNHLIVQR